MSKRLLRFFAALCTVSLALASTPVPPAHASTTWHVTILNDGVANPTNCPGAFCKLRDAIAAAAPGDTIVFDVTGTITLTVGDMDISTDVTITGPGTSQLTIDAASNSRIFGIGLGHTVTITGMILANGLANDSTEPAGSLGGGGIVNEGILTLDHVLMTDNRVECANPCTNNGMDGYGGAVFSGGSSALTITNSVITDSSAKWGGGAIFFNSGTSAGDDLSLINVNLSGNQTTDASTGLGAGGAMQIEFADTVSLNYLNVSHNTAAGGGGGLFISSFTPTTGFATILSSTFDSNQALGTSGLYLGGGAIYNASPTTNGTTVSGSTFTGNISAMDGGAIMNSAGYVAAWNNTFSGNSAQGAVPGTDGGGGIRSQGGVLLLMNNTLSGNAAATGVGGALYTTISTNYLMNNILADSQAGASDCASSSPTWTANFQNLVVTNESTWGPCPAAAVTSDPLLAPLADNGGITETMALAIGSPAIGQGSDSWCANASTVNGVDQRNIVRPQGAHCDIGAYELEPGAVDALVAGNLKGVYDTSPSQAQQHAYAGVNSGPAQVVTSGLGTVVSSIRVLYGGSSYSEMMGFPNNSTNDFWFPWYNDVAFDSQFRVSNLGSSSTTITVYLNGGSIDSFSLGAGAAVRKNYPGQNNGPMHVSSSGQPILATIRVLFGGSSYSEMMGFPNNSTTNFWFPWYNNTAMDSQFRVSNLGASSTTITVSLAGSPIDSFTLGAGAAVRKNYAGQNNGPMQVSSSGQPILATIRVLYGGGSYSEMMGFPSNITTGFYFPWYDNVGADTQVRVSNLGGSSTTITVSLNGSTIDSYSLGAGAAIRKNYPAHNDGDLYVTSSFEPILATERILYGGTSFYELMGYPDNMLTGAQYFPWYNNTAFSSQLRFVVP